MWKLIVGDGETKYGPDYTWLDLESNHALDKLAAVNAYTPPTLLAKSAELQDSLPPGKAALYNRALGSFEAFGLNRNGDGFQRHELISNHDTFVKNANYFKHHVNKDITLSRGRPVASAFNEQTDMVDIIIVADMDKCAEQIHALESGKRVPTSMGAKVSFDVCTICKHAAKTREDYCEHVHKLASAPYGMRAVLSDGRVCGVMNPNPRFFDISDVVIGAAPESETLLKVAEFTGFTMGGAELAELAGLNDKHAAITKRIPGHVEGAPVYRRGLMELGAREEGLPDHVIKRAREAGSFDGVIRNSAALGIVLNPDEFSKAAGLGQFNAPTLADINASESMPKKILSMSLDKEIMSMFSGHFEKRSAFMPALINRVQNHSIKTASFTENDIDNEDLDAKAMYTAYRKSLLEEIPHVGGHEGEYWIMKCAETTTPLFTDCSRGYLESAFLTKNTSIMDKVLDRMNKIAEPIDDEPDMGIITGNIAEEIGIEALDRIAVQSLRNLAQKSTAYQTGVIS